MTHHYTVIHGGVVLTLDGALPTDRASASAGVPDAAGRRATAIAYAHERILAVGSDDEILPLAGPDSDVFDLRGLVVVPGFQDAHAHPLGEGIDAGRPLAAGDSLRAGMAVLSDAGSRLEPDAWLVARYDQTRWRERRHPTRDDLDRAIPDRPVVIGHVSGHAAAANSLALAIAGVSAATDDVPGRAVLDRDERGEPTGVVYGADPMLPFADVLPTPAAKELVAALRRASAGLAADGITATADADLGMVAGLEGDVGAYVAAAGKGRFVQRITLMPGLVRLARADEDPPTPADIASLIPEALRDRLRVQACKLKADGALTTRTALLRDDYADEAGRRGRAAHEPGALVQRMSRADRAGWQVCTHAIGDAAIDEVLDALESIARGGGAAGSPAAGRSDGGLTGDRRYRIEHAMLLDDATIARMARLGAVASLQPEFVAWAGDTYLARLGTERASRMNRYASLLAAGIPVAFGSDRPVVPGAPLDGIRATLRHAGPSGRRLAPGESPSPAEALHAYTAGAAYAAFDEDETGRIAIGMRTDLTVLSADPTDPGAWRSGAEAPRVVATIVGGDVVHGDLE